MNNGFIEVIQHPLIQHKLSTLRDVKTSTSVFRALLSEIGMLLAYEATRDLPVCEINIQTPLESMMSPVLSGKKICIVSILRAGNGLLDGILRLIPSARVGHIGMERDETTHKPKAYYCKLPESMDSRITLVVDPMLATGHSAVESIKKVKRLGAKDIRFISVLSTPEGINTLREAHPDVQIITACVDRGLDEKAYIRPGLGDAGDRLYGTN